MRIDKRNKKHRCKKSKRKVHIFLMKEYPPQCKKVSCLVNCSRSDMQNDNSTENTCINTYNFELHLEMYV